MYSVTQIGEPSFTDTLSTCSTVFMGPTSSTSRSNERRKPKKSPYEKEQQLTNDRFLMRSTDSTDELHRVKKYFNHEVCGLMLIQGAIA
jgi:hypothetical protein